VTCGLTVSTYGRWLKKKAPGALDRLDSVAEQASGSRVVAEGLSGRKTALTSEKQGPYLQALTMESATRIEPATCGLRNSENPTSDNLNPQETTSQDAPDVGAAEH